MIRANIEAEIQEVIRKQNENWEEIKRIDNIIDSLKQQQRVLLDLDTDYTYKLEELKEQLEE